MFKIPKAINHLGTINSLHWMLIFPSQLILALNCFRNFFPLLVAILRSAELWKAKSHHLNKAALLCFHTETPVVAAQSASAGGGALTVTICVSVCFFIFPVMLLILNEDTAWGYGLRCASLECFLWCFFFLCSVGAEQFCAGRECECVSACKGAWARNRVSDDGWSDAFSSLLHDLLWRFLELNGERETRACTFGKVKKKTEWVKSSGVQIAMSNKSQMTPIRQRR